MGHGVCVFENSANISSKSQKYTEVNCEENDGVRYRERGVREGQSGRKREKMKM